MENGRLFHTSVSDPLTGLFNHAYFHDRLATELATADRHDERVTVVWLDIDDFTRLNRLAGQTAGDDLLRAVAGALAVACGENDVVCRVGGDEFAIIARGTDAEAARLLGLCIEAAVGASAPGAVAPSVSGGYATGPLDSGDAVTLASLAERTAAWARRRGKGRVLAYDATKVGETADTDEGIQEIEERSRLGTLQALAAAVDARREASGARSASVAALSGALARQLGLDEERVRLIEVAALVHDVGMVSLGDDILAKPGPLTAAETQAMRRHPALGEQIVGASAPAVVVPWIRHHHERWDGEGYPDGLRAVAIPLESRIIAVCDAWDAMISERPWRRALTATEAVAQLRACAGTQFDPELIEPLIKLVEAFHRL
jgi:diguanylate cyclase (GGDEF)-like protein